MRAACSVIPSALLLVLTVGVCRAVEDFDTCCSLGRKKASFLEGAEAAASCVDAPPALGRACSFAFSSCCLEALHSAACGIGMTAARNESDCRSLAVQDPGSRFVAQQCCMCCALVRTWNVTYAVPENGWCFKAMESCGGDDAVNTTAEPNFDNVTAIPTNDTTAEALEVDPSSCPAQHDWNPERRVCEKIAIACPKRFFFDKRQGHCVKYDKELLDCDQGYQHNFLTLECEDIDECAANRSLCVGKESECANTPGSFKCLCRIGYRRELDGRCTDIDECALGLDNCHTGQGCNNKPGGFKCVRLVGCGFGYTLDHETQECHDIDECKTIQDVCEIGTRCHNVPGSYICKEESCRNGLFRNFKTGQCQLCRRGYRFDNQTRHCRDVDECQEGLHNCNARQRCENTPGSFQCRNRVVCDYGFRISANGITCEDVNECAEKRHECNDPFVCVNSIGSYACEPNPCRGFQEYDDELQKCRCKEGFREKQGSCIDIDECKESRRPLCRQNDVCVNSHGSYFCQPYTSCEKGYIRPNNFSACVDVDECKQGTHTCNRHAKCTNLPGSYACICKHGFRKNDKGMCEDIDECVMMSRSRTCPGRNLRCINVIGSFICECQPGYTKIGWSKVCEDIDECRRNRSICGFHTCRNLDGGYECRCLRGYRMSNDRKSCSDVNECDLFRKEICPNSPCINTEGSYHCACPTGYRPNARGICQDTNECAMNVCKRQKKECINLRGSFRCLFYACPPNYDYYRISHGYRCVQTEGSCHIGDTSCLHRNPKMINSIFVEVENGTLPMRVFDVAERSTAEDVIFTNSLSVMYAMHPNRGPIAVIPDAFRVVERRYLYHKTVTVIASGRIPAPMDVRLELRRHARGLPDPKTGLRTHLFDSVTFITVYITRDLV